MDKGRKKKRDHDFSVNAFRVVQEATEERHPEPEQVEGQVAEGKNLHAVALGRLGGLKGGKARNEKLTPEQRSEIGRKSTGLLRATLRLSGTKSSSILPERKAGRGGPPCSEERANLIDFPP